MSMSDKELQEAYRRSQQAHNIDSDVKQRVMLHHSQQAVKKSGFGQVFVQHSSQILAAFSSSGFKLGAVAFALLVTFGMYNVIRWQENTAPALATSNTVATSNLATNVNGAVVVNLVDYHGFDGEGESYRDNNYRTRFNVYTQNYYASQELSQAVKFQHATLYADNGNWMLVDCEQTKLVVSQALLDSLNTLNRIQGDIKVGMQVALAFDEQGKILTITRENKPLVC